MILESLFNMRKVVKKEMESFDDKLKSEQDPEKRAEYEF